MFLFVTVKAISNVFTEVAPMPNHHLVKGYRTSGHKALPILDPGNK